MAQTAQAASAQPEADADIGSASGRLKNRGRSAWRWAALALLVACAFLIRIWGVTKMHFWDENVYLLNAEYFYGGHAGYLEIDSRPPLLSLLFAAAFHAWHSDYAAEIVAMLLNALGPLFLFLAGCRIVGRNAAAIAALLLAFVPFFIGIFTADGGGAAVNSNGHSLRTDCPALTLILLALWLGTRALAKQTDLRFAAFGFSMAMAVLMRFASLSSVGFLALLLLAADRRVRASCGCAGGFLLGMAPYLCWSRAQYGGFLYTFINGWWNFDGEAEPFDYFAGHLPLMISWLGMAGLALWFVRRSADVAEWRRSGKPEGSAMGAVFALRWELFLWLWAAGVFLFFSILSHKELRYG
ncbi:MAG: glycosyltransferase family 39 protein, partial [Terracidiphilus sp.]